MDFLSIYTKKKKKKTILFSWPRIPFLTAGVERAAAPVGWGSFGPHTRGTAAAARSQKCLMPQGPLAQLQFPVGLGPGGPTCRLLGAVRPLGDHVASGGGLAALPSCQASCPHHLTRSPIPLLGRMAEIYCTSDSGYMAGLAGAGGGMGGTRL